MYEFVDRPVTDLDHGGRFLVWSMRSWVKAKGERNCAVDAVAGAFGKWGMLSGLQPFLRIMALFNRHGLENFEFCALPCNHVSEHEAIIISLVCGLRDQRPSALRETLDLLVEEEAVGDLLIALSQFGKALSATGIFPCPPGSRTDAQVSRSEERKG